MANSLIHFCNKSILALFYSLFFLIPLIFVGDTFELFEFNKMWLTFVIAIFISLFWLTKSIAGKRFAVQRTPLDIPILLFFCSQLISTFASLDTHISIWGYYSRFNGGLLSTITYIILYYAFVSNVVNKGGSTVMKLQARFALFGLGALMFLLGFWIALAPAATDPTAGSQKATILMIFSFLPSLALFAYALPGNAVKKMLFLSVTSATITAIWGLPSHFSHDPTCLLFRGNFDIACWTEAFAPNVRMFSTLGQPDWFGAYLAIIIPIALALTIHPLMMTKEGKKKINVGMIIFWSVLLLLLFVDLMWSNSKSAFLGGWAAIGLFLAAVIFATWKEVFSSVNMSLKFAITVFVAAIIVMFLTGAPFSQIQNHSLPQLLANHASASSAPTASAQPQATAAKPAPAAVGELGGTDSGKIRSYVWQGALEIWKNNPLFGTGVETFAFAYYQHKPPAHNLTSEWDYLYNKAHNEYLNYLATTGAFGLGTYLLMIGWFFYYALKYLPRKNIQNPYRFLMITALLCSYVSILITDFFGFSVVITNLYLFLIPAFVFLYEEILPDKQLALGKGLAVKHDNKGKVIDTPVSGFGWIGIAIFSLIALYLTIQLIRFWQADKAYALGYNLDHVNQYQQAYPKLHEAVSIRSDEPTFYDELSINDAVIGAALLLQKQPDQANQLITEAINTSDKVLTDHPNNVVFWKTRVRIFYTLAQADPKYIANALQAVQKAYELAPTDAKIVYNLGLLYGQNNDIPDGIAYLQKAIQLKSNYEDAYYALGLFYHEQAVSKKPIDTNAQQQAVDTMHYILQNLDPQSDAAQKALKSWGAD